MNLDISSDLVSLIELNISRTAITWLDTQHNQALRKVDCSNCENLKSLNCDNIESLIEIVLVGCTALESINCSGTSISSLNVESCRNLQSLDCSNTPISSLNFESCRNLHYLSSLDCNKLLKKVPSWFSKSITFRHDARYYDYEWKETELGTRYLYYKDRGYGWWYEGEPGRGYH